jgi:hypothetical protein
MNGLRVMNIPCSSFMRTRMRSNNALERPVKGLAVGAAGAWNNFAPAALGNGWRPAAQRGR